MNLQVCKIYIYIKICGNEEANQKDLQQESDFSVGVKKCVSLFCFDGSSFAYINNIRNANIQYNINRIEISKGRGVPCIISATDGMCYSTIRFQSHPFRMKKRDYFNLFLFFFNSKFLNNVIRICFIFKPSSFDSWILHYYCYDIGSRTTKFFLSLFLNCKYLQVLRYLHY